MRFKNRPPATPKQRPRPGHAGKKADHWRSQAEQHVDREGRPFLRVPPWGIAGDLLFCMLFPGVGGALFFEILVCMGVAGWSCNAAPLNLTFRNDSWNAGLSLAIAPNPVDIALVWPTRSRLRLNSGRTRFNLLGFGSPRFGQIRPASATWVRTRPNLVQLRPVLDGIRPAWAEFGVDSTNFGPRSHNFGLTSTNLARNRPNVARNPK